MDNILKTLIKIYKMQDVDWMGYRLNERFSYHHLIKQADGGKRTVENGAVLYQTSHSYLHMIEYYDFDKYLTINQILKEINVQRCMPTKEQLKRIDYILREFENEYDDYISSRDKILIKEEYKKRISWRRKV